MLDLGLYLFEFLAEPELVTSYLKYERAHVLLHAGRHQIQWNVEEAITHMVEGQRLLIGKV